MGNRELKNTIELLNNYKTLVAQTQNIKIAIAEQKNLYLGCKVISYGDKIGKTNKFSSCVENEVVDREKNLEKLNNEFIKNTCILSRINNALEVLNEREKAIVDMKYFKQEKSWERIAETLDLSAKYCRKLNVDILNKLSRIIYVESYIGQK